MATFTASGGVRFTDTDGGVTFVAGYQTVGGGGGGGGATTLNGLDDVVITAAASGDILRHNGTNWVDVDGTTIFDVAGTAAGLVDDLSGVSNAATARSNLGLGDAATKNVGTTAGTVMAGDTTIPAAYTDEMARDALGTALVAGSNITITPNDGADTITIAASSSGSVLRGPSTWNSVQNYSTPGVMWDALANALALAANTIRYTPFLVPSGTLAVDRIWFEVTTLQSGSNARVGVWAADINWQPTGAPLIDATTTTATTGAKNITVSASLPAGRYIAGIVSDANISVRCGTMRPMWGSDHSGTAVAAGGSSQIISNRRVALTYPGTMPTPGPAWTTIDTGATNMAGDAVILLRGTFS
jgi:hypothetical protein